MAELVASAFLSSFLQVAFERLASHDFLDYFRRRKMDDGLLIKLHVILLSVDKIVEDAEKRQYRDRRVKLWLDVLKDEVFKAQDLLDDIATEALRQKLHFESQTATGGEVRNFFTGLVNQNQFNKEIESGIQGVLTNLDFLIKQNKILGLRESSSAGIELGVHKSVYKRLPSTRLIDESDIYGRNADKETIGKLLLSQSMGGNRWPMNVIAITGMGGMGKTTLAKLVYEDVKDQFEHRAWVCVSEEFDVYQLTKATLRSLNCPTEKLHDLHSSQLKLKETLMGKKFFLVLDDVWNENCKFWEDFRAPLKYAAPLSKILVTTRHRKVAQVICCTFIHSLKPLEGDDCWNLFAKHAFNNQHHATDPDLEEIGRKIVNRCGGLPLAIKTLGSLLHRKPSLQDWDKILKSVLWELSENDSHIIPSLRLSYHYLPSNLKRCFVYCSIFPKDYNIDKNVLIQLWMADGLIYPTQKNMSLEQAGNEVFNDLESRSFFEPSRNGDDYFIMHDLVNDLAKSVTQEFSVQLEVDQAQLMSTRTRYFSIISEYDGNCEILEKVFECQYLRCFLLLLTGSHCPLYKVDDIMSKLSRFKYMRELSLSGYKSFKNLTEGISNLEHLHYLDLSETSVEKLPDSMCLLINLQTLKLRMCFCLLELPSDFYKLVNLRHLDLDSCGILEMPKYLGKLNQLRTMNQFVVAENGGSNIKEFGALKHVTGSLAITNMKCIKDAADMREADLKAKQLQTLELRYNGVQDYSGYYYSGNEAQHQGQVLEALEPNHNVKDLTVEGYGGTKFPKWLADGSHLVSLNLWFCPNIEILPPLGQLPSLQKLTIAIFDGIKVIGEELYGNGSSMEPFPCLSYLKIAGMEKWEEWDICYEGKSFPCLEELDIRNCSRLKKSLPQHLPRLKTLLIESCENLEAALPKSSCLENLSLRCCRKITEKDMPTWSSSDVLPPLHNLTLDGCPAMESLPQGGMLSSLRRLSISWGSKVIASGRDWGLHELLSLKQLRINDIGDMECFPEEGLLPPNLQSLSLSNCHSWKRINHRGFVHLHSLTSLSLMNCPRLSFEGMPEDGLPPSLSHLSTEYCKLLKERCEKEKGPDWPIIAHIPHIEMEWCRL
ncbi:hypothetical protein QN277_002055 [Acacia crassicarpa]|uniref:Disease resistance RPP13-like protein 1 n=1 Tax=Acacia crassicarpa TaxID=499986 RepID=A0AAE1THH7_9FABA|nr:hypothetical protein QN277_002055 [Acacia crassicarpa]